MSDRQQQTAPDMRQRAKHGCALLIAGCAAVLMACVLGGVLAEWRGGELPELNGRMGVYRIVGYTTVAPSCSPVAPCTQRFADVPLPHYYVIWLISQSATNEKGTRVLTIPLTLPLAR